MVLTNDLAALIGFACEALLWGAYVVLFLASTVLFLRRGPRRFNAPIFVANCTLFASCTAHFALELSHYCTTLLTTGVDGFANETHVLVGADILISFSDLLAGLILLYRCWVIWGKKYWIVLPPFIMALGGFACILAVAHLVITLDPTAPAAPPALVPLGLTGYALPLGMNALATGLIAARLLFAARRPHMYDGTSGVGGTGGTGSAGGMSGTGGGALTARAARRAVAIIVESGALYLAAQLAFVVLFARGAPAQAVAAVIAAQIYGIAPTLMVMQVALGFTLSLDTPDGSSSSSGGGTGGGSMTHVASGPRAAFLSGVSASSGTASVDKDKSARPCADYGYGHGYGYGYGRGDADEDAETMEMKLLALRRFDTRLSMSMSAAASASERGSEVVLLPPPPPPSHFA